MRQDNNERTERSTPGKTALKTPHKNADNKAKTFPRGEKKPYNGGSDNRSWQDKPKHNGASKPAYGGKRITLSPPMWASTNARRTAITARKPSCNPLATALIFPWISSKPWTISPPTNARPMDTNNMPTASRLTVAATRASPPKAVTKAKAPKTPHLRLSQTDLHQRLRQLCQPRQRAAQAGANPYRGRTIGAATKAIKTPHHWG